MTRSQMRVNIRGVVSTRTEASRLLLIAGDCAIVVRSRPRLLLLRCPCGCGDIVTINLDPSAGPAWKTYLPNGDWSRATVYPSVWRDSGCMSHFIISRGNIFAAGWRPPAAVQLRDRVYRAILIRPSTIEEIAVGLNEDPWSVAYCCRLLATSALVVQRDDGTFCDAR